MKKALVILVLFSLVVTTDHAQSQMNRENPYDYLDVLNCSVLFEDFRRNSHSLGESIITLSKIEKTIDYNQQPGLSPAICNIRIGRILCDSASNDLAVFIFIKDSRMKQYRDWLGSNLICGTIELDWACDDLERFYPLVKDKIAIQYIDEAKKIMRDTLDLYRKAIDLLPKEK